uniref:Cytochrome c biogenesis protein CcsB n=1 Tax=Rhodymenia pseudopalmata TaxID=31502 RepID=A0A1C9C7N2_RHOPU|nr:c-type cytochrome biogenensis protein [Rhodymenia pseudopalmata]AOM64388.1 c-type cytochrome biogenensis protein [Rhodymenia pseudopalmata]
MSTINKRSIAWNTLKKLANLNFSIFMLILISSLSVIGTIVEQEQAIAYYKLNYPTGNNLINALNWKLITYTGIDHIYTTWWFIFVLILFFLSLSICTLSTQLPGLNNSRNWKFLYQTRDIKDFVNTASVYKRSLCGIIYSINRKNYYVFYRAYGMYAYKGLMGRISPVFVHISIILILTGAMSGLINGFMVQEMIPSHEVFHIDNIIKNGRKSNLPQNLLGKVDNFFVTYNADGSIKQFYSDIRIFNYKYIDITRSQISVNHPFVFKRITFYQTDWNINGIRMQIGSSPIIQKKINKINLGNQKVWGCSIPIDAHRKILVIIYGPEGNFKLYNSSGELLENISLNEYIEINHVSFFIKELMLSTGLQIKIDPGIILVYIGFFILIISVSISYISYSQIWINCKANSLILSGSTNRAALSFEEDLTNIRKTYLRRT